MIDILENNNDIIKDIVHQAVFNAELLNNSLYKGKLGRIILFYHYADYSYNSFYKEFAEDLIGSLFKSIDTNDGINIENGLSGIAWGLLYLNNNNFIDLDIDALNKIDQVIMCYDPRRFPDLSFNKGLAGVLYYVNYRLSLSYKNKNRLPFDETYYKDIEYFITNNEDKTDILNEQINLFKQLKEKKKYIQMDEMFILNKIFNALKTFDIKLDKNLYNI